MEASKIQKLIKSQIIKKQYENEYRLVRPLQITVLKTVLDKLKSIYKPDYEKGGLLEGVAAANGTVVIEAFHQIPNGATNGYNYNPNTVLWDSKINEIIARGNLPFAIHTHPLTLGIESYDNKRSIFYLKPSKQDKGIAREGITPYFNFPEAIFTKDSNLDNGFGLNFFTGYIFPSSITAISTVQAISLGASLLGVITKSKTLFAVGLGTFFLDFYRRANYEILSNGDYKISLTA